MNKTIMISITVILSLVIMQVISAGNVTVFRKTGELSPFLVGGTPAEIENFPYQVYLSYLGRFYCGGSILDNFSIVTSAHCAVNKLPLFLLVRFGSNYAESGGYSSLTSRIYVHPDYNPDTLENDIAILIVIQPLLFNDKVNKIQLPAQGSSVGLEEGTELVVTGFGLTAADGDISEQLMQVHVPVTSVETCVDAYGHYITDNIFCAGYDEAGKDHCNGDSGGPLATKSGPPTLIGIVSFADGCARPGYPGAYTKVSSYTNWIKATCWWFC